MGLVVGDVGVNFVAKLDGLFKGIEKAAKRLEDLSNTSSIKVKLDDRVFEQLDRIAAAVENLSNLGDEVKTTIIAVFDAMNAQVGNLTKQAQQQLGFAVEKTEKLADDAISRFVNRVRYVLSNVSPMALAQFLGIALVMERLVQSGFNLAALVPTVGGSVAGLVGITEMLVQAIRTLDPRMLLGVVGSIGGKLLSVTAVVGLLFGAVRGATGLISRFLDKRPEGRLQAFVQLISTLNRGLNELLKSSQVVIAQVLFIGTGLVTITTLATSLFSITTTGLTTLTGLVTPIFALTVFGITLFNRVAVSIRLALLRARAAAGDGRAQTMLFLQALRQLYPILEAIAKQARPIAKMIRNFARGGLDKRLQQVVGLMNDGLTELKEISKHIKIVSTAVKRETTRAVAALSPLVDKGKELQETLGRKGARDALGGLQLLVGGIKLLGTVGVTTFKVLTATARGFFGKDSPFGLLFNAQVIGQRVKTTFQAMRKAVSVAFGETATVIREKLVATFRNAEKPLLFAVGDMGIAASNVFLSSFAVVVNPIRALIKKGLTPEGFAAAGFAIGAAVGKAITSSLSLTFRVGGVLFKLMSGFFQKVAERGGGIFSRVMRATFSGLGRLLGGIGRRLLGRTGAPAADPDDRAQRKRSALQRQQVEDLRNKREKEVVTALEGLLETYIASKKNSEALREKFKRTEIVLTETANTLDAKAIDRFNKQVLAQVDTAKKYAGALTKAVPSLGDLEKQIREAAKRTGMAVADENRLVAAMRKAHQNLVGFTQPIQSAADRLESLKKSFREVEGGFVDLPIEELKSEIGKAGNEIGDWRKEIRAHEKELKALEGVTGRAAEQERRKLARSIQFEKEAEQQAVERRKAAVASLARQQLAKQLQKEIQIIEVTLKHQQTAQKKFDALSSTLETTSRAFGASGLRGAAETLEKTGKKVISKQDQQIQNIENQIRDAQALRERASLLRKERGREIENLAKRNALDAEIAVIESKLAKMGQTSLTTQQMQVAAGQAVSQAGKEFGQKIRTAGDSFSSAGKAVNDEARRSMAQFGKAVTRASGDLAGMSKLIALSKSGATEARLAGRADPSSKQVQDLKHNPAFKFFEDIAKDAATSEEAVTKFFAAFTQQPLQKVEKIRNTISQLFAVIKRSKGDVEAMRRIIQHYGSDQLELAIRIQQASDAFKKFLNLQKVSGGKPVRLLPEGDKKIEVLAREFAQVLEEGVTDVDEVMRRLEERVAKSPLFTGKFKLKMARGEMQKQINRIFDAARGQVEGKAKEITQILADYVELHSPPRKGPLRRALLSLPRLGQTIAQQIEKGKGGLVSRLWKFLRPFQDFLQLKSPPLMGPLRNALLSLPLLGGTIGKLILKGLGALRRNIDQFLRRGIGTPFDNFITRTAERLKDLDLTARRMRMDPSEMMRFNEAIGLLGGKAQDAETALMQLTQNIDRALQEGSAGELANSFNQAGLALADLEALSPSEIFMRLSAAVNAADGDLKTQSELLRLVGGEFTNMRGIVLSGTGEIQKAFEEVSKRPPLDDKTVETAKRFARMMERTRQTIQRIAVTVFSELGPAIEDVLEQVTGKGVPSINQVLELVKAGTKIFVRSVGEIAQFVRKRYVEAQDGLDNFLSDVASVLRVIVKGIGTAASVLFDKLGPVVSAGTEALMARIGGKTKSALAALLAEALGLVQDLAIAFVALSAALVDEIWFRMKQLTVLLWVAFLEQIKNLSDAALKVVNDVINETIKAVNKFISMLNTINAVLDKVGIGWGEIGKLTEDVAVDMVAVEAHLTAAESAQKELNERGSQFGKVFKEAFRDFRQFADVDKNTQSIKDFFNTKISVNEVALALDEIRKTSETAEERLDRLRDILKQVSPDDALLELSDTTVEKIEDELRALASVGKIIPGTIVEGRDRLIKETTAAFEAAGGELAAAFKTAFDEAGRDLKDLAPELFALGQRLDQISREELAKVNTRLAELREKGVQGIEAVRQAFEDTNEEALIAAARVKEFEFRAKRLEAIQFGLNFRRQWEDAAGAIGPFAQAQRELVDNTHDLEKALIDVNQKIREIGDDYKLLEALGESFGLLITSSMSTEEIRAEIERAIGEGFESARKHIRRGPVKQIVRDNFVAPILDGFKETLRGIVDGSLLASAKEAEKVAKETGQKFSRVLFMVADFGKRIFETAFNNLLDKTMEQLTEGVSDSIAAALDDVDASGMGDAVGSAIGAALQAAIAVAGLMLSRLQSEVKAQKEQIDSIVESTEAVRGVISGQTTVAIKEVQDTLVVANRPITLRLDELIRIGRELTGGGNIPITPLARAGGTTL